VSVIRIATHCTEADVSEQHFRVSRDIGLETVGFLMMAHTQSPEVLARQGRIMVDAGCQCVYVVDSAGALLPDEVAPRVEAMVAEVGGDAQVGFHGHESLTLALANTLTAIRGGAVQVDGSTRHFGAGSGNTATEALAAVCDRMGIRTGIDALAMFDVAEDVVRPIMDGECLHDRLALIMGYAGVYSSFLKHAFRAAERYHVSGAEILLECGRQQLVGGQEDQIIQIAAELAKQRVPAVAKEPV
jgi:4-hydroxy 2-oxovalerate aldolase